MVIVGIVTVTVRGIFGNESQNTCFFCGVGGQGTLATKTMKDMGVKNVKNISGGMAEWNKIKD